MPYRSDESGIGWEIEDKLAASGSHCERTQGDQGALITAPIRGCRSLSPPGPEG